MAVKLPDPIIAPCISCLPDGQVLRIIATLLAEETTGEFGENGAQIITDTAVHTGDWTIITAMQDATYQSLKSSNVGLNDSPPGQLGGPGPTALTQLKGITIYGSFSEIQLQATSPPGVVIAYKTP